MVIEDGVVVFDVLVRFLGFVGRIFVDVEIGSFVLVLVNLD